MARGAGVVTADVGINKAQWARLMRDLKQLEPETRKELVKKFKELLTGDIIPAARGNASWSSRIPGAIRPQVTSRRVGLQVQRKKAPHAAPFEGRQGATFRHPVFGNRNVWVEQSARPFLQPAVDDNREAFMDAAGEAVDEAARQTGWT